jgi:hypothetical protein
VESYLKEPEIETPSKKNDKSLGFAKAKPSIGFAKHLVNPELLSYFLSRSFLKSLN